MYKVLIVDDDKLARKGLISIVPWQECGMTVVGDVSNGVTALEFIEKNKVDLVIVDLSMPVLSGLDFIKENKEKHPEIYYVVLSFHEGFEYIQSALRLGALDYISKLRLEQEDCAEIFSRVRNMMDASARDSSREYYNLPSDADIDRICQELDLGFWIFDDDVFVALEKEIRSSGVNSKQMYKLFIRAAGTIEDTLGIRINECDYDCSEGKPEWFGRLYTDIFGLVAAMEVTERIECLILKAVIFIDDNLCSDNLKAELIADSVNMSRGYFSINFKKYTGNTVNNYIRKKRIALAKIILSSEKKISVSEVAMKIGYRDEKYFAKLFLEHEGVTCSEYRKQMSTF